MYDINAIEVKRWRELILKRQEIDADKKLFLEGEKISKIIEEADDENVLKNYKDVVADYITEKYQKYGNLTNEEEKEKATREFQEYVNLKEKEIREMQDKTHVLSVSTYEDYNKDSVKELNSFLIRSSIREHTRQDDEEKILDTFDQMKVELIKHNIEALKKYKYYAEKNGLYTCSLPKEDDKKGEGKPIATTLQKMYEISDEEFEDVINPIIPDER